MAVNTSYPGVYIEEFTPAPPIQGVGTSTAALLGPTKSGPIGTPTLVTSFDQFKQISGAAPLPGFYLWYAVRGFFTNGGTLAYIVRVSNAAAAARVPSPRLARSAPRSTATACAPASRSARTLSSRSTSGRSRARTRRSTTWSSRSAWAARSAWAPARGANGPHPRRWA